MAPEVKIMFEGKAAASDTVKETSPFELTAVSEEAGVIRDPQSWAWTFKGADGKAGTFPSDTTGQDAATLKIANVSATSAGEYTATATYGPQANPPAKSATFTLTVDGAEAAGEGTAPREEPPKWPAVFAWVVLFAAGVVVGLTAALTPLMEPDLGLSAEVYDALTPANKLAARVIGPTFLVGLALVVFGLAMALVEWRGRFAAGKSTTFRGNVAVDPAEVIKALGALRGAGLVLIGGLIVILATAWMTSSTTAPPAISPSVSSTPPS
ncbi:hypothetical protein [Cellulomonas fengjieae]|uniref:Ig-like domain-containing protein n=1 Tax=Cellulomonas fengjieae TaxID=2819978 RepID=A0ABS3SEF6_9CELL|nr:hypothetical protein [Cellulomonas fengjieae]MBO3084120.1 hypothetical protein [Cellulomonas fengjieae]QVI64626.1 hypothetical protein KG102_10555 [Cellulomonas fengjieae]